MWNIIISLSVGVLIGLLRLIPKGIIKWNGKIQRIGVFIILFCMGASIGANKELLSKLGTIGTRSVIFAVLTIICSVLTTYMVTGRLLENKK